MDKPARLVMVSEVQNQDRVTENINTTVAVDGVTDDDDNRSDTTETQHYDLHLVDGSGGTALASDNWIYKNTDYLGNYSSSSSEFSSNFTYAADGTGTVTVTSNGGTPVTSGIGWPLVWGEHCVVNDPKNTKTVWSDGSDPDDGHTA